MALDRILPPNFASLASNDPREVGDFRLLGCLGVGGMGTAYLAEGDGQWVVVKVLRTELAANPDFRTRLSRELDSLRRVPASDSIAIVAHDLGCASPWFAMEYVEGQTLVDRVRSVGPLHGQTLTSFAHDLGQRIQAIHQVGITHRDIKPSNIVLSPTGPRIIDFGIAIIDERTAMTTTGVMVGTLGWAAPEQVAGDPVDEEADVHAWGLCVLYASTGKEPFAADSAARMLYKVVHNQPDIPEGLPEGLDTQISAALRKNPASRPTMANIILRYLEPRTQVDTSVSTEPTQLDESTQADHTQVVDGEERDRGRGGVLAAAVGIVMILGVAVLGFALLQPSGNPFAQRTPAMAAIAPAPAPTLATESPSRPSQTPSQAPETPESSLPPRVIIQSKSAASEMYEVTWDSISVEDTDPERKRKINSLLRAFTDEVATRWSEMEWADGVSVPESKGFYDAPIEQINCDAPYLCFLKRGSVLGPGDTSSSMFVETFVVDYETAEEITVEDFVAPNQLRTLVTLTERAIIATAGFNQLAPVPLSPTFETFANVIPFDNGLLVYVSEKAVDFDIPRSEVFVRWDLNREIPSRIEQGRAEPEEVIEYICPKRPESLPPLVDEGADPTATRFLQTALIEWFGQDPGPVNGSYGPRTIATVKSVQEMLGIFPDGQVGPVTWLAIQGWFCFAS